MFVSRGRTRGFIQLGPSTLREAIAEALGGLGKEGLRLVYYTPEGLQVYLEASPSLLACIAAAPGGAVAAGEECLELLARRADDRRGVVEIIELTEHQVAVDAEERPEAVVPGGLERLRAVLAGVGRGEGAGGPQPAPGEAAARPAEQEAGPAAGPGEAVEAAGEEDLEELMEMLRVRGLRLSDTFNVLALAALSSRGRAVEVRAGDKPCMDIVDDALALHTRVAVVCRGGGGTLYVYADPGAGRLEAYYMDDGGGALLGAEALRRAGRLVPREVRVYVEAGG
ncbi:hypothetical protein CF15_06890 [Pyrodictium occultum]|uniref:Uncharacterized protein n=1 Tax=Pyrodictium occultum TaxID=2309 RepID=A0A0V8RWK3_PYROC|nr:hypothetical protein [Pyrodictium occultum]KSW12444.1 hypothetical protein CF15_06890 [Pyrodictium occultum]